MIFAEDGATLDLRGSNFATSGPPLVIYSPRTTILGNLSAPTGGLFDPENIPRQVSPLSLSRNIGPFNLGVRVNVAVVGDGIATVEPAGEFVAHSSVIKLTATPAAGSLFKGWSGSLNRTEPVLSFTAGTSDRNFVATFSSGYELASHAGPWGGITTDPAQEIHPPGQVVALTATPLPGYRFVKWGGELVGTTANPAAITMDANRLVTAVFEPIETQALVQVTAVDAPMVSVGEMMEFTGTGFTSATAVSFFGSPYVDSAEFEVVSDTEMRVEFPEVSHPGRERFVLIESATSSTVTMSGEIGEFSGLGSLTSFQGPATVIVKAGAVLSGFPAGASVVYVESGGVLRQVPSASQSCVVIAESGATLDLRGVTFSTFTPPLFLHGPETVILGNLPGASGLWGGRVVSRQIPPPSISRGIGPFVNWFKLVVNAQGRGSVTVEPALDFYPPGTSVTVTAVPSAGSHFVRWSGGISGTKNPVSFAINSSHPITARFSDRPDFFIGWRQSFFSNEELADPAISGLNADPDGDQITNAGEYAFGSDPKVAGTAAGIEILPGSNPSLDGFLRLAYSRPVNAADINYILQARQATGAWFDGTAGDITFEVTEEGAVPQGDEFERITLLMRFTGEFPPALFLRLNADIGELP